MSVEAPPASVGPVAGGGVRRELDQALTALEMRAQVHTGWLLAVTIAVINLVIVLRSGLPDPSLRAFVQLSSAAFLAWFVATAVAIRRGWYRPWFKYLNVVVQVSAVTFALLGAEALVGLAHPMIALLPLFYLLVVGLTSLTLNPLLCLLAGGFAVGQFVGAYLWWAWAGAAIDWTGVYLRGVIMLAMSSGALLIAYRARRLLEQVAARVQSEERLRALEWEMQRAAEVQERLIPSPLPAPPFLEVESWYRPSRHVGGDYFDLVSGQGGRWTLLVGDVAGKGYGAALTSAGIQSTARVLVQRGVPLEELMATLNGMLHEVAVRGAFASLVAMEMAADGRGLRYLNCGHNPPLLVCSGGEVVPLSAQAPVLGVVPAQRYGAEWLPMERGDVLFAYTDGLTELRSRSGREWGEQRLRALLQECRGASLRELHARLLAAVDRHLEDGPPGDDISFVAVRNRGVSGE